MSEEDASFGFGGGMQPDCGNAALLNFTGIISLGSSLDAMGSQVEEESIQMDVNRESLKRKLMFRRTLPELVNQGIYPPLNVPPAFADRQRHLQRAQTGDRLRQKLKDRPDRECLVQHHILEDTSVLVDRSLQDKQRLLKRSRLQSDLSGRLASRPGPLELITKNILQTDPQLKDGLIEGKIPFTKTNEVDDPVRRILHPDIYQLDEDDYSIGLDDSGNPIDFSALVSNSDDSLPESLCLTPTDGACEQFTAAACSVPSPLDSASTVSSRLSLESSNIPTPPDIAPFIQSGRRFQFISSPQLPPAPVFSFSSTPPTVSATLVSSSADLCGLSEVTGGSSTTAGNSSKRNTKKPKSKNVTKSKVIKFHEYKGPPSTVKMNANKSRIDSVQDPNSASSSTAYGVLLEQQQLFLQWQLEFQQKALLSRQQSESALASASMTTSMPSAPTQQVLQSGSVVTAEASQPPGINTSGIFNFKQVQSSALPAAAAMKSLRLEDWKVADLKSECKRLNLPSHGPKPVLIERLSPHFSKLNVSCGLTREPVSSFRSSESSLSGSSEVTSPISTSLDSSLSGILANQKPAVPVSMNNSRPSAIVPMDVDQNCSQGVVTGGTNVVRPPPAAFIFVQTTPQPVEAQKQAMVCDSAVKDQMRTQMLGARQTLMASNNFSSSNIGSISIAQPVMLVARPPQVSGLIKAEDQTASSLTANAAVQPLQAVPSSQPNPGSISSEELVIRQQHLIATLEKSLQQYQRELLLTQQKALIQQIQLSNLTSDSLSSPVTNVIGESRGNAAPTAAATSAVDVKSANSYTGIGKDLSTATVPLGNGNCNPVVFAASSTQNELPVGYKFTASTNGIVTTGATVNLPPCKPFHRSATSPVMPFSFTSLSSSHINSSDYLTEMPASLTTPLLSQSPCPTMDDILEVLIKRGELERMDADLTMNKEFCDIKVDSSNLNNRPLFFLPETHSTADSSDPQSITTAGSSLASVTSSAMSNSASHHMNLPRINKVDQQTLRPDRMFANSVDASGDPFPLGVMEWTDYDLDLISSQMDIHDSPVGNSDDAMRTFDLDINGADWLTGSDGVLPVYPLGSQPQAPFIHDDFMMMQSRSTDAMDFFKCDETDPFTTPDLSMTVFDKVFDAQTSTT